MAQPTILWTFLPNGITDNKLKFSAAVSIRLPEKEGEKLNLGLFPEILNWPKTVKSMAFDLEVKKSVVGEATKISPEPDLELWNAIFQPDSPVIPFGFSDLSKKAVISFPVKHIQSFIAQQYVNIAAESPEEIPSMERVFRTEALGQIRLKPMTKQRFDHSVQLQTTETAMSRHIKATIDTQKIKAMPVSPKPNPPEDFYLLRLYHQPKNKVVVDPTTKIASVQRVAIKPPELDFHQAISYLSHYPALMRLLGLVIDFEVPLPAKMPKSDLIRIVPRDRDDETPWTKYTLDATKGIFTPAPRSSKPEVVNGFLDMSNNDEYDIIQVDIDGAALKSVELADKAEEHTTGELPALQSRGLSVVRTGNAVYLATGFQTALDNNLLLERKKDIVFYAEDLVQGYRIDVWDDRSRQWHSLCKRIGTYNFLRLDRKVTLEDEGFFSENVTHAADDSSDDMFTHESIFSWNGWSLIAPRPGKTINEEDKVEEIQSRAATAFRLETQFKPTPSSLPRLRFGAGYRLRARIVDLAGNSLASDVPDDKKSIPSPPEAPFVYARFDPVSPPIVVPREKTKQGETVDEIVIRSFNDRLEKDIVPSIENAERHIVPPKTSQLNAETHGMFDGEAGLKKEIYTLLCDRDAGKIQEIEPGEEIELPYFPDPWAKGVVIRGLPLYPVDKPLIIDYAGDWPDWRPFRLRVEEGNKPALWDSSSKILTVYLKKSDMVTLRLSSYFPKPMLPIQGLYRWLEKPQMAIPPKILQAPQATTPITMSPLTMSAGEPKVKVSQQPQKPRPVFQLPKIDLNVIQKVASEGSHWMMTPFRTITLIHAVQQPLGIPGKRKFQVTKNLGNTYAVFEAELDVHGPSTTKVDLLAQWQEPIDNLNEATWRMIEGKAHVLEFPLQKQVLSFVMNARTDHRHEFGDTKYRKVSYNLLSTTRFKEQMPKEIANDADKISRRSDPIEIDVPNSAPPALPKVLYIVPTFGWERKHGLGKFSSVKKGGGLRVYLERPWFSSGDGELLAVILPATPAPVENISWQTNKNLVTQIKPTKKTKVLTPVPDAFRPYVTLWGIDPIWRAGDMGTPEYPLPEDFSLAEKTKWNLPLIEVPDNPCFTAVGHKVSYDEERQLWYCDIEINPHEAYYPFVRLVLARFQPISVSGAYLSPVVTADFIQLTPDRTVSVSFNYLNLRKLNISVSGASYIQNDTGRGPGEIEVTLETRDLHMPEDLGWTPVEKTSITLSDQRTKKTGQFIWSGKLTLPNDIKIKAYRLAIREYESFTADVSDRRKEKVRRRLVFAETIPLLNL